MRTIVRSLASLFLGLTLSCDPSAQDDPAASEKESVPPPPKPLRPAPELTDDSSRASFSFSYEDPRVSTQRGNVQVGLWADKLRLQVHSLSAKTKITIGTREVVLEDGDKTIVSGPFDLDAADLLARVALDSLDDGIGKMELDEPITIELPGHEPIKVEKVGTINVFDLHTLLARVADGPLRFPGDESVTTPRTAAVFVDSGKHALAVHSKATLADVRFVGLGTDETVQKEITCRGYGDADFGGNASIKFQILDVTYVVFDRLTGERLAEKTFKGAGSCPKTAMRSEGGYGISFVPDRRKVAAWIKHESAKH